MHSQRRIIFKAVVEVWGLVKVHFWLNLKTAFCLKLTIHPMESSYPTRFFRWVLRIFSETIVFHVFHGKERSLSFHDTLDIERNQLLSSKFAWMTCIICWSLSWFPINRMNLMSNEKWESPSLQIVRNMCQSKSINLSDLFIRHIRIKKSISFFLANIEISFCWMVNDERWTILIFQCVCWMFRTNIDKRLPAIMLHPANYSSSPDKWMEAQFICTTFGLWKF